jgi:hypothetical protein
VEVHPGRPAEHAAGPVFADFESLAEQAGNSVEKFIAWANARGSQ